MTIQEALNNKQFSEYLETIENLYGIDEDFRCLCDDYCTSKSNIEKFREKLLKDRLLANEFESLSNELEMEILEYLENIR